MSARTRTPSRFFRALRRGAPGRLLTRLVRPVLVRRGKILSGPLRGCRFSGGGSMLLGTYEGEIQDLLVTVLRPSDVFYDVGAHHGYFTLLGARLVADGGHVFSFEPLPRNLEDLRRVIRANALANVTAVAVAVSDRRGDAELFTGDGTNPYRPSLLPVLFPGEDSGRVTVPTTTLDALAATHRPPDVVKVDVEGAEIQVLQGGLGLMRGPSPPTFIVETHSRELHDTGEALLRSQGYRVQTLGADHRRRHLVATPAGGKTGGGAGEEPRA